MQKLGPWDHRCWVRWGESGVRAVCTLLAYNNSPAEEGSQSGNRAAPRITSAYTFSGLTSEIQTDCGPLRCSEGVWLLWKCWKLWKDLWIMLWTWWLLSLLWFVVFATLHGGSSSQALSLEIPQKQTRSKGGPVCFQVHQLWNHLLLVIRGTKGKNLNNL